MCVYIRRDGVDAEAKRTSERDGERERVGEGERQWKIKRIQRRAMATRRMI